MSVSRGSRQYRNYDDSSAIRGGREKELSNTDRMTLWEQLGTAQDLVAKGDVDPSRINLRHAIANSLNGLREPQGLLKTLKARERLLIASYVGYELNWSGKIKLVMRFLTKWGNPCRYFRKDPRADYFNSVMEKVGYSVFYVKVRKR